MPDFNDEKYRELLYALSKGLCIFYGAGVSKLAGYKTWEELRKEMISYFWKNKDALPNEKKKKFDRTILDNLSKHPKIIETFDYLYYTDKNLFTSGIKKIFKEDEEKSSNEIFEILNKIRQGNTFYVTTNIDKGLQNYLGLKENMVSIFPNLSNPPSIINYLHGKIDKEDTWVFTTDQYNKGYSSDKSPCKEFLTKLFEDYNVLFIGYGLNEDDITRTISSTQKRKSHWWLEGVYRGNQDSIEIKSTKLRENYNIKLIPYSIEYDEYSVLKDVLNKLYLAIINKIRR